MKTLRGVKCIKLEVRADLLDGEWGVTARSEYGPMPDELLERIADSVTEILARQAALEDEG